MNIKHIFFFILISIIFLQCNAPKGQTATLNKKPSDIMPSLNKWKIKLGDGQDIADLIDYEHEDFFYTADDGTDWVVYKTPNSGITSRNSSNTRTELHQLEEWRPQKGGKLNAILKVQQVSTSGDARVAASYSTVVGQIHSSEGHENEPIKIFYKKFPGHEKGSVFWNYEINTEGDNSKRWDFSSAIWGHDMSVVGDTPNTYPAEPTDGIKLGEEFSYEINVYKGVMYLTFKSSGHPTKTFTKSLIASDFIDPSDIPKQTIEMFVPIGRDGTEKPDAYAIELQYFKLGAYNQTNGKDPKTNMVWSTGSDVYEGDLKKQYENGSYSEIWFRESRISEGTPPSK